MGSAWSPEAEAITLQNFEIRADGTIAPRLRKSNHMQVVRALWEHRPSELWARVACPVLMIPAVAPEPHDERTRDVLENKRRIIATAEQRLKRSQTIWMTNTIHDIPLQRPAELAAAIKTVSHDGGFVNVVDQSGVNMNEKTRHNPALSAQPVSDHNFRTVAAFKQAIADNLYYNRGQAAPTATREDVYAALAFTVRDYLVDRWQRTVAAYSQNTPKFVYYLSAEYLPGRQITQNLLYTDTLELAREALAELGFDLDQLLALEPEPALGNGGLGRLAACYLDSLATLDIPSVAYGINYEYGIFKQSVRDGWQVESPDDWLYYGNPWEFPQPDNLAHVGFGGHTEIVNDPHGGFHVRWIPAETILGEPSHMLVPGLCHRLDQSPAPLARARQPGIEFATVRRGRLHPRRRTKDLFRKHHQGLVPQRHHAAGPRIALEAAVFLRVLLAARHHASLPDLQFRLAGIPRQSGDSVERHASRRRHSRIDARVAG